MRILYKKNGLQEASNLPGFLTDTTKLQIKRDK